MCGSTHGRFGSMMWGSARCHGVEMQLHGLIKALVNLLQQGKQWCSVVNST
jgi:hypothetical protein